MRMGLSMGLVLILRSVGCEEGGGGRRVLTPRFGVLMSHTNLCQVTWSQDVNGLCEITCF